MKVLIAVPAFNEAKTIASVLNGLPTQLDLADSVHVVVVDDGSTDDTGALALAAGARLVAHRRNLGLGAAFNTAVREALAINADVLVTIDADGQFDAGQIPELLAPIRAGKADVVTGSRFCTSRRPEQMPRARYWGNRFFAALLHGLLRQRLSDVSCGFRAYSREALMHLNLIGTYTYTQESLFDLVSKGLWISEVPIRVEYFADRESHISGNLLTYGINALKVITRTARDFKPLRFFGAFAGLILVAGLALNLWLAIHFLRTGNFSPYKFVGFTGTGLVVIGILILGFALLADMLDRLRVNQERILYLQRKVHFERMRPDAPGVTSHAPDAPDRGQ